MTKTDTIGRVARPRGVLSEEMLAELEEAAINLGRAKIAYRELVLEALKEGSFAEVSRVTTLSKDTLQRWKREAGK